MHQFADVICLNRYYGWYMQGGYQLIGAKKAFIDEMNQWMNTEPNKPFLFTEYVADTDAGAHKLPSVQWSEEYQCEYLTMQHEVFDMFEQWWASRYGTSATSKPVKASCASTAQEGRLHSRPSAQSRRLCTQGALGD